MKKKLLLVLSMMALVACLFALCVSAANIDGIEYSLKDGEATVTSANKNCTVANVVIPQTVTYEGTTYTVTKINDSAFRGNGTVVTIVTPSTIKSIGDHAFREMSALEEITINASEELLYLNNAEVYQCKKLKKADLSGMVGLIDLGNGGTYDHTFVNCTSLTEVKLPKSLKVIGSSAFNGCSSLASIDLHEGITTIKGNAFTSCAFTEVVIPSTVTYIGDYAFQSCKSLEELNIPVGVTYFGCNNFQYTKVTKVVFPSTVTGTGKDMFNSVYCLDTVVIGCADVSNYNGTFFSSCGPLNYVFYAGDDYTVLTNKYSALKNHKPVTYEQYLADLRNPEFEGYEGKVLVYGTENCDSCGDVDTAEYGFIFEDLLSEMYMGAACENCGAKVVSEKFAPVFVNLGYSTFSINGYCSVVQGFKVNYASAEVYNGQYADKALSSFGVLAVAQSKVGDVAFDGEGNALEGVVSTEINNEYSYFEIKVAKIPTEGNLENGTAYVDAKLHLCAYAVVGNEVYYISEGYVGTTLGEAVSFSSLQK